MTDKEKLAKIVYNNSPRLVYEEANNLACRLIANGVTVQKHGRWILHDNGSGTCDQCRFTQKNVWDYDNWQNYCGVCGADMRERKDGE